MAMRMRLIGLTRLTEPARSGEPGRAAFLPTSRLAMATLMISPAAGAPRRPTLRPTAFGGARIARRDNSGAVYYFFADHLGTAKVMTNATGVAQQESTYYAFGGEQRVITNTVANAYKFTGFERDSESGLDDTLFRKYASNLGRWLSPDPMAGDILNPQSLNRYGYALNNPVNFIDPLGLDGFNPADPCTYDLWYAASNARCGSPGPFPPPWCYTGICGFPFPPIDGGGGGGGGGDLGSGSSVGEGFAKGPPQGELS
jgi:RHS repeat-associated protein